MTTDKDIEMVRAILKRMKDLIDEERADIERAAKRKSAMEKTKLALDAFSDLPEFNDIKDEVEKGIFEYNTYKTWGAKLVAFFKYKNKVLTPNQVFKEFRKYETKERYTDQQLRNAVATEVNKLLGKGELKKWKPKDAKMKGYYYGSPLWFNENKPEELLDNYKPVMESTSLWE